ncbi:MAG: MFS transporter [Candidatus Dormibacteraeota bacterium]|nr:MFS transporter [Candidatus Dormibacteraeota bacterium]MBO0759944.1 MFS transporter [Candidatus Dormibacteraeota bacterium]
MRAVLADLGQVSRGQWQAMVVAMLGYSLDAMDFLLYALVLPLIATEFHLLPATAGFLSSVVFLSAALGGYVFGFLADRIGRSRTLIVTVLLYSVGTAGAAFSRDWVQLLLARLVLGLGMGGEWGPGMTLVLEKWPARLRSTASAVVQSAWAIGYVFAVVAALLIVPHWGWRGLFLFGIVPAVIVGIARLRLVEPEVWQQARTAATRFGPRQVFSPPYLRHTVLMSLAMIFGFATYNGIAIWLPTYLTGPLSRGGAAQTQAQVSFLLLLFNVVGIAGFLGFALLADRLGRRRLYALWAALAALGVLPYALAHGEAAWLVLGVVLLGFGTSFFGAYGAATAELYPTEMRASALGFTFNTGRLIGGQAPVLFGVLAVTMGLGPASLIALPAALLSGICFVFLPERRGVELASVGRPAGLTAAR